MATMDVTQVGGLKKTIHILNKVGEFSRWTNIIGLSGFFIMVVLSFVDVIMRYFFNSPIRYVSELIEVGMITSIFLAIAYTQNQKGHISVDVIVSRLTPKPRVILEFITTVLGLGIFAIIIWQNVVEIPFVLANNIVHTQSFPVSKAPFLALIVLGCSILWIFLVRDLLVKIVEARELGMSWYNWLLMFSIPALILVFAMLWAQPTLWQMSYITVGFIGIIALLVLFLMGMPISFSLFLISFLFVGHIRGANIAFDIIATDFYRTAGTYSFSAVNFFVLIGFFCLFAAFGVDLYRAAYKWIGHIRGGLAIATIGACTGYAAIVGDCISAVATMGSVALPEMKKYNYDNRLTTGCICAGAILGPIIPPSVTFLFYGLFTHMSIGDLFVAGIIPGLITAILFIVAVYIWCRISPSAGLAGEKSTWRERIISLKATTPVVILFILVIGGIYKGVFTPTEGGSIGAGIVFLLSLVMRRFTWKSFTGAMLDSGKVISMIFLIVIGGVMFTHFMAWCNMSDTITKYIASLHLAPVVYVIATLIVMFVLGCFMDIMPILLIVVPILHPIAVSLGIDPIWFAVLVVLDINLGSLTPPVGIVLFVMKGIAKDIPMDTIYKGTLPFVVGSVLAMAIVFVAPSLATWLPSVLK
jgi:tripartite ATP-independent transporter DctM subunit